MNKKNIIVITNLFSPDKAMVVKNFSDENVKEAIGKLMNINPEILTCEASSMSSGIYKVNGKPRGLKDEVKNVFTNQEEGVIYLQVSYASLQE